MAALVAIVALTVSIDFIEAVSFRAAIICLFLSLWKFQISIVVTFKIWSKQVRISEISLSCTGSSGSMPEIFIDDIIVRAS